MVRGSQSVLDGQVGYYHETLNMTRCCTLGDIYRDSYEWIAHGGRSPRFNTSIAFLLIQPKCSYQIQDSGSVALHRVEHRQCCMHDATGPASQRSRLHLMIVTTFSRWRNPSFVPALSAKLVCSNQPRICTCVVRESFMRDMLPKYSYAQGQRPLKSSLMMNSSSLKAPRLCQITLPSKLNVQ